jgi:hypothetical protein
MRDTDDQRRFAEEYLTAKLHELDTALQRHDSCPDLAIDFEGRRRLVRLRAQMRDAVRSLA